MFTPMFAGKPAPQTTASPQRIFIALVAGAGMFCLVLLIALFMFLLPYHGLRQRAAAFDASPYCHAASPSANTTQSGSPTPCTTMWANVLTRYYSATHSSRSSPTYRYYVQLRGGYGDEHTVQLMDSDAWWRVAKGDAVRVQRWGDRLTAVTLPSGETSPTAENPDWQLTNDERGLRVLVILFIVVLSVEAGSLALVRQLLVQRSA